MLTLIQIFIVCSFVVFTTMPIVFMLLGCIYLSKGEHRRGFLVSGSFILGALAGGFCVWQLIPSAWTLPFWTTLEATVDSKTYGHDIEHYAEGIVLLMTCAAMLGGAVCAGAAALGPRLRKKFAHS